LDVIGEAGTAADGIAEAARLRPEAILLDVGLPDRNGIEVARELSALPWSPRIVLTSTDPDAINAEAARRHGACGFVRKHDLFGEGTALLAGGS
jgi:DNA-binding NarL/FixJ family response regulator